MFIYMNSSESVPNTPQENEPLTAEQLRMALFMGRVVVPVVNVHKALAATEDIPVHMPNPVHTTPSLHIVSNLITEVPSESETPKSQ
jgi:hypothetical protein